MNSKLRWLPIIAVSTAALFCGLSGMVLGQGPILTAFPTPTPMPIPPEMPVTSDPISAAALPDLIVTKIETDPASPAVGQSTTISVTIKNNSSTNLTSGNNFNVDLYIDPPIDPIVNYHQIVDPSLGLPWGVQYFWVPAGGSYTLVTTWVFTDAKTFELWAQVDSDGNVNEADEDNNTQKVNLSAQTSESFRHATHQDFLTNMASTLENDDPGGVLRLGRFQEPPLTARPYTDGSCQISSSSLLITDYNMEQPDTRIHDVTSGRQVSPYLIANGEGMVIAVWEDGRNGDISDRDVYLRYSTDFGLTWGPEERINDDVGNFNQLRPVAALSDDGNLLIAWQDRRNGNYDIYAQRFLLSGTTLSRVGSNILVATDNVGQDQINPDIAVDDGDGFHVVWQDKRNGNYDIFSISYIPLSGSYTWTEERRVNDDTLGKQQSNPAVNVIDWFQVTDIDYVENPDGTVTVTQVHSTSIRALAIVWEDYSKDNADIAITISEDGGETFAFDDFINDDATPGSPPNPNGPDQLDPDVALTKDKAIIDLSVELSDGSEFSIEVEIPVTSIHTVWQDYRNGTSENPNPDIYYSMSQLGVEQVDNIFQPQLTLGSNEKINEDDARPWQTQPVIQRDPTLAVVPCGGNAPPEEWNRFIVWADGRNYDSANYDIYYSLKSDCGASLEGNEMLNDGVRLYNFDSTNPDYSDYDPGHPPPGKQLNPGVAADLQLDGATVYSGYLYLAWEDDRTGDPQQEKEIFFARSNLTFANQDPYNLLIDGDQRAADGAGSQISNILDSGSEETTWFTLAWSAATDDSTYITVQTRLGNSINEVLAADWYPQRFPYQPQPGACTNAYADAISSGAPLAGYNAPGQHIEDETGAFWPQARYIQYRVNFYTRNETKTPELYDLTIYYEPDDTNKPGGPGDPGDDFQTFLPLILK